MARQPLKTYLCLFAQQHPEFRLPELLSLASVTKSEVKFDELSYSKTNPLLLVHFPSEESACRIAARSLLIRSLFELWGSGRNHDELEASVNKLPSEFTDRYRRSDYTFKVVVRGFSRKCSAEKQLQLYERLSYLPLAGKVNLSNPDYEFHLLEDYGDNPNEAPMEPHRVFVGRLISHGQRHLIQKYAVKNRHFIGNTSMDAQLSLIMANMAQVKEGSLVFDPFVGTGSLLVAGAHFGGFGMGADIDYPLIHGRGICITVQYISAHFMRIKNHVQHQLMGRARNRYNIHLEKSRIQMTRQARQ
ncbi:tRNA (guanine(10)-N2)-methyltransferase homolog [Geodia barretti]|uniref:tRNA (Guanine(10)-N2)-methyltransferase homolog n=1 Tax=Geodia barretti TaxID=519541 RepID=A0AA35SVQ8_GEOBA|nr:tRNA (guanine(10)-N2)-methyltransferase homolog [Geodia barretti]